MSEDQDKKGRNRNRRGGGDEIENFLELTEFKKKKTKMELNAFNGKHIDVLLSKVRSAFWQNKSFSPFKLLSNSAFKTIFFDALKSATTFYPHTPTDAEINRILGNAIKLRQNTFNTCDCEKCSTDPGYIEFLKGESGKLLEAIQGGVLISAATEPEPTRMEQQFDFDDDNFPVASSSTKFYFPTVQPSMPTFDESRCLVCASISQLTICELCRDYYGDRCDDQVNKLKIIYKKLSSIDIPPHARSSLLFSHALEIAEQYENDEISIAEGNDILGSVEEVKGNDERIFSIDSFIASEEAKVCETIESEHSVSVDEMILPKEIEQNASEKSKERLNKIIINLSKMSVVEDKEIGFISFALNEIHGYGDAVIKDAFLKGRQRESLTVICGTIFGVEQNNHFPITLVASKNHRAMTQTLRNIINAAQNAGFVVVCYGADSLVSNPNEAEIFNHTAVQRVSSWSHDSSIVIAALRRNVNFNFMGEVIQPFIMRQNAQQAFPQHTAAGMLLRAILNDVFVGVTHTDKDLHGNVANITLDSYNIMLRYIEVANVNIIGLVEFIKLLRAIKVVSVLQKEALNYENMLQLLEAADLLDTLAFLHRPQLAENLTRAIYLPVAIKIVTGCRVVSNELATGLCYAVKKDIELEFFDLIPSTQALNTTFNEICQNGKISISASSVHKGVVHFQPTPDFLQQNFNIYHQNEIFLPPPVAQNHVMLANQMRAASQFLMNFQLADVSQAISILQGMHQNQNHPQYFTIRPLLNQNVYRILEYINHNKLYRTI